ncbi:MAG: VanZ family protein [Calditrichaeota bacterium]|nr:VanZ family protein [Calditrichota bacterium]
MGNRLNAHAPWIIMMVLITIQSSIEGFDLPKLGIQIEDKLVHFLIFGILGWLLARGMSKELISGIRNHPFSVSIIMGILFAVFDEWHQSMVPGRDASAGDLIADTLGILVFVAYFYYKREKLPQNSDAHPD